MISKEKLVNGYIENDKDELRGLWIEAATYHGFDKSWVDESFVFDDLDDALDCRFCFIRENSLDSGDGINNLGGRSRLTLEDFTDTSSETTKQEPISAPPCSEYTKITAADIQGLRDVPKNDIFKRMLSIAKENNLFIQFDGFTQDENDAIVVTHAISDTEYAVKDEIEFNKLVESLNVLNKFERK